jgi:hypothetical protein
VLAGQPVVLWPELLLQPPAPDCCRHADGQRDHDDDHDDDHDYAS